MHAITPQIILTPPILRIARAIVSVLIFLVLFGPIFRAKSSGPLLVDFHRFPCHLLDNLIIFHRFESIQSV